MEVLSFNQSNLILSLLICSITDIIWDFISSLCCCRLSEHDGVQQESSCYFGHCTQMNLMSSSLMIIYTLFSYLRTLVEMPYIEWNKGRKKESIVKKVCCVVLRMKCWHGGSVARGTASVSCSILCSIYLKRRISEKICFHFCLS